MKRFWGIVIVLVAGFAFLMALTFWQWQNRMMQVWVPVRIHVLSTDVERHSGKSTTYMPRITYTYWYKVKSYESSRVTMMNESASSSWAWGIINRFKNGKLPAYVDPDKPEEAILVHEYSVFPLVMVALTAFGIEIGLAMILGLVGGTRKVMTAIPFTEGWQLLLPTLALRSSFWRTFWRWLGFSIVMIPLLGHFVMVARPTFVSFYIVSGVTTVIWITLSYLLFRCWSISRHVSDARLQVRPAPMVTGRPFVIRAEFDANSRLKVEGLQAKVVCVEHYKERLGNKTSMGTRNHLERTSDIVAGPMREIRAGDVVGGEGAVETDEEWPVSYLGTGKKNYPYYTWEVRVTLKLEGMVDYDGVFPLNAVQGEQSN